jgi:hypothetical protein
MDNLKVFAIVIIAVHVRGVRWRKHGRRAYNQVSGMKTLRLVQAGRLV